MVNKQMGNLMDSKGNEAGSSAYKKVLGLAGVGWLFDAMDVGLLSFIMVALTQEWGLTDVQKGLLGTGNLVGMALGAALGGYFADKVGRRPIFMLSLLVFGIASGLSVFAVGFVSMLFFRFAMGLGLGAELPVASTMVGEHAPASIRGRVVVLLESFWAVGWILAAVIAYFVIADYGWKTAVLLGGIPALFAAVARKSVPESPLYEKQASVPVGRLFTDHPRETVMIWIVWFAVAFSYYGMFLWLPSVMVAKGFTMIKSFEYVLIMTLAQLPGYALSAWLIEKWGRKYTLSTFLVGTAGAAWFFGHSDSVEMLLLSGSLLSFFNLGAWGALYAYTPEQYPTAVRGSGTGFAAGFGRIGSVFAPYMVGMLISAKYSFGAIFGIFTVVILIGALSVVFLGRETKGKLF